MASSRATAAQIRPASNTPVTMNAGPNPRYQPNSRKRAAMTPVRGRRALMIPAGYISQVYIWRQERTGRGPLRLPAGHAGRVAGFHLLQGHRGPDVGVEDLPGERRAGQVGGQAARDVPLPAPRP